MPGLDIPSEREMLSEAAGPAVISIKRSKLAEAVAQQELPRRLEDDQSAPSSPAKMTEPQALEHQVPSSPALQHEASVKSPTSPASPMSPSSPASTATPGSPPNFPKRRSRTVMTPYQTRVLQRVLQDNAFPTTEEREQLSQMLGVPQRTIQVWFQNQRQKARNHAQHGGGTPRGHAFANSAESILFQQQLHQTLSQMPPPNANAILMMAQRLYKVTNISQFTPSMWANLLSLQQHNQFANVTGQSHPGVKAATPGLGGLSGLMTNGTTTPVSGTRSPAPDSTHAAAMMLTLLSQHASSAARARSDDMAAQKRRFDAMEGYLDARPDYSGLKLPPLNRKRKSLDELAREELQITLKEELAQDPELAEALPSLKSLLDASMLEDVRATAPPLPGEARFAGARSGPPSKPAAISTGYLDSLASRAALMPPAVIRPPQPPPAASTPVAPPVLSQHGRDMLEFMASASLKTKGLSPLFFPTPQRPVVPPPPLVGPPRPPSAVGQASAPVTGGDPLDVLVSAALTPSTGAKSDLDPMSHVRDEHMQGVPLSPKASPSMGATTMPEDRLGGEPAVAGKPGVEPHKAALPNGSIYFLSPESEGIPHHEEDEDDDEAEHGDAMLPKASLPREPLLPEYTPRVHSVSGRRSQTPTISY